MRPGKEHAATEPLEPGSELRIVGRPPGIDLATPPMLMGFDCDPRSEPLWYRRVALEEAIQGRPRHSADPSLVGRWA
jgi:hypothetical protein